MLTPEKTKTFIRLLEQKVCSLGFPSTVAESIVRSIQLVQEIENSILLVCHEGFYRDSIIVRHMPEISDLARSIFGNDITMTLASEAPRHAPTATPAQSPRKRLQRNHAPAPTAAESQFASSSIFDFVAPQETMPRSARPTSVEPHALDILPEHPDLNADFTFSTFVRGQSNSVAFSACESVAMRPGKLNNPVFIYGDVGLGKTHLLHSVGNDILRRSPAANVVYLTSGNFVSGFVSSIRHNSVERFKQQFLDCDVLLVDDIQFLENKEQTQLEFFHIFNQLIAKKKQIVITSDKYPKDIPHLSERLRSRFLQGLLADIEPPCFEERIAILEAKAETISLKISRDVVEFIATNVKTNVREMQGVLNNLLMRQTISGLPPTIDAASTVLRGMVKIQRPTIDIPAVQKLVAAHYNIKQQELVSASKAQKLVVPRHVAMYLSRKIVQANLVEIAQQFGRKDHTTVLNAIEKVEELIQNDASTRAAITDLKRRLEQNNL
jgi:chromosomal replication initiator protein